MFSSLLKNLSILKKFLFINLVIFVVIGSFTIIYISSVKPNLIKNKTGKKGKDLFKPIRLALTGKEKGPELKYLLPLLTKEHILKKLGYI